VAAVALLVLGCTILKPEQGGVHAGGLTVKPLEAVLAIGLLVVVLRDWRGSPLSGRGRSPFGIVIACLIAAATVGAAAGLAKGATFSVTNQFYRDLLSLLSFYVFRRAFIGRSKQLGVLMVVVAAAASVLVIIGIAVNSQTLVGGSVNYVITGSTFSNANRVAPQALQLMTIALLMLAGAAVFRRRPLLRAGILLLFAVVEAYSFNRSSWTPLLLFAIVIAGIQTGRVSSILRRGAVLAALGVVVLALAGAGTFGSTGKTMYDRAVSITNPQTVNEHSFTDRSIEDVKALDAIERHPVFGVGLGNPYGVYISHYDSDANVTYYVPQIYVHNSYLGAWIWLGLLGIGAFTFLAVRLTRVSTALWRTHRAGAVAPLTCALGLLCLGVQATFQTELVYQPALIAFAAGLAYIECWMYERREPRSESFAPAENGQRLAWWRYSPPEQRGLDSARGTGSSRTRNVNYEVT